MPSREPNMLLTFIVGVAVRAIFPLSPAWVVDLISKVIPLIIELVQSMWRDPRPGVDKFVYVTGEVNEILDTYFDGIPEWSELEETQRDRIVDGLVELVVFLVRVAGEPGGNQSLRKLAKALRRMDKE